MNANCAGPGLALISGLLFTAANFSVKAFDLQPCDVVTTRSILICLSMGLLTLLEGPTTSLKPEDKCSSLSFLLVQGLISALGILASMVSVVLIPFGDAVTLIFTSPFFTSLYDWCVFGKTPSMKRVLFMMILFLGIILVAQPPTLSPKMLNGKD